MLGECYYENGDLKNSIKYYKRITENIMTDSRQMALAFTRTGDVQKEAGLYMDAIESYRKALERMDIRNNYLLIAGIYDNDLHDTAEAVVYYEKYLDSMKDNINIMLEDHLEKVRLRVDYLKNR
jgi:tetratricopeptide (TPR) repeat protein